MQVGAASGDCHEVGPGPLCLLGSHVGDRLGDWVSQCHHCHSTNGPSWVCLASGCHFVSKGWTLTLPVLLRVSRKSLAQGLGTVKAEQGPV